MIDTDMQRQDKPFRILIAEDSDENRIPLKLMLELSGFEIAQAIDGRQAINEVNRFMPDLILMDISLPEIDGLQATREIRKDTAYGNLPIIIISAHDNEESRRQATDAGCSDYLSKPIDFDDLKSMIFKYIASTSSGNE